MIPKESDAMQLIHRIYKLYLKQGVYPCQKKVEIIIYYLSHWKKIHHITKSNQLIFDKMQAFKELGITKESSVKDIERAFKKLSLIYHPDKNPENVDKYKNIVRMRDIFIDPLHKDTDSDDENHNPDDCVKISTQIKRHSERFRKIFDEEVCNFVPYYQNFHLNEKKKKEHKFKEPLYFQIFLDSIELPLDLDLNDCDKVWGMIQEESDSKKKIRTLGQMIKHHGVKNIDSKYAMMLCKLLSEFNSIPYHLIIIDFLEIIDCQSIGSSMYHDIIKSFDKMIYRELNKKLYDEKMHGYIHLLSLARIQFLEQFISDKESESAPNHYKFKISMCQGILALRQSKFSEMINRFREAVIHHHTDEAYDTVISICIEYQEYLDTQEREIVISMNQFKYPLSHNQRFKVMKYYETLINRNEDPLEKIWQYIDMVDAVQGLEAMKQSLVCASYLMIKYGESQISLQYRNGAFCVVKELLQSLGLLCIKYHFLSTGIGTNHQIKWLYESLHKMALPLFVERSPIPGFNNLDLVIYMDSIRSLDQYKALTPIHGPVIQSVHDSVYESTILNDLTIRILKFYSEQEQDDDEMAINCKYYLMQGSWDGWYESEEQFDKLKFDLMGQLVAKKNWNIERIEEIMRWGQIPRDNEGFMVPGPLVFGKIDTKSSMPHESLPETYSHIHGFTYDYETGQLNLILEKESVKSTPLFTQNDIDTILRLGISESSFTLDQPGTDYDKHFDKHPCQLAKCSPKSMQGTESWGTMLFADLFMKYCSLGVETSCYAPFLTKSIDQGIGSVFSQQLRDDLKMEKVRISNEVHRFWFEVDSVGFNEVKKGSVVTYMFNEPKMIIQTHRMKKNESGEYIDTDDENKSLTLGTKEDIDELNKLTPEQKFAQNFTTHYNEIA